MGLGLEYEEPFSDLLNNRYFSIGLKKRKKLFCLEIIFEYLACGQTYSNLYSYHISNLSYHLGILKCTNE